MKRWPLVASFLLFLLLCASAAYWGLQLFKPPLRTVAAPPPAPVTDVRPESGAALFGGRPGKVAVASNYQLRGVVMSGSARDSVAIVSADGKPALAVRVGSELIPGVVVKEVHRDYVLLSEGGVVKRVELPDNAAGQAGIATAAPVATARSSATPPSPPSPLTAPPPPPGVTPTARGSAAPSQQQAQPAPLPMPAVAVNPPPTPTPPLPQQPPQPAPQPIQQQPTPVPLPPAIVGIVPQNAPTPAQPATVPAAPPATLAQPAPAPAPVRSAPLSTRSGEMRDAPLQSR